MLEWLWGVKTVAIFDVWSFEHILSGLSVGDTVKRHTRKHLNNIFKDLGAKKDSKHHHKHKSIIRLDLIGVLFLAYIWEAIEHYLESGVAGNTVAYWFQGVEFWPNRLISDPLMLVLGYYIAKKYPVLVWPARGLSLIWLLVHIFVFPHSMYLHQLF